jgi:DNA-binding CsgD family transcriptional regulator
MAKGLGCRDIGRSLGISAHTVRKHRSNMLAKTGTSNAAALLAHARRLGLAPAPDHPRMHMLSPREAQVHGLVVAGCTSKVIARRLGISDLTVRKHRENLMRKLAVRTTAALLAHAPCSRHE